MKIGLALGGGGAKGFAHVLVLEAMEELGLKPAALAGTSMGAVIAGARASGLDSKSMRQGIREVMFSSDKRISRILFSKELMRSLDFLDANFKSGGLIKGERFLNYLYEAFQAASFEELDIPLKVAAADYHNREQVVLDKGDLLLAIRASLALPILFQPVEMEGRLLMDGSAVNPVPWDLLPNDMDIVIGVDVMGERGLEKGKKPSAVETILNTYQIMMKSITLEKLKRLPPDIFLEVDIVGVKSLEFYRFNEIFRQAEAAKDRLKRRLEARINARA